MNLYEFTYRLLRKLDLLKYLSDEAYLRLTFHYRMGRKLNLEKPETFNEKLQWLKLYDRKPIYSTMVDKYEAKKYVAERIGEEHIIPTLGVWDHFDEIDFDELPNQFVLKCTHDSGGLVICKDKTQLDLRLAKDKLEKSLASNYYYSGREWPYKNVKPRIIAEAYMVDNRTEELRDYKFFCFNGQVKCFKVDFDRFIEHHANYYDAKNNLLRIGENVCPPVYSKEIVFSKNLETMKKFAEMLSNTVPFLRADFYDVNGEIYFGELTFFPASGFGSFTDATCDLVLGKWIEIPGTIGGGGTY